MMGKPSRLPSISKLHTDRAIAVTPVITDQPCTLAQALPPGYDTVLPCHRIYVDQD
jgi:hypothetical protein